VPFLLVITGGGGVEGGGLLGSGGGTSICEGGAETGRFAFDIPTGRSSTRGNCEVSCGAGVVTGVRFSAVVGVDVVVDIPADDEDCTVAVSSFCT